MEQNNHEVKLVTEEKTLFTITFEVKQSKILPNHSYIIEKDLLFPNRSVEHGPIPDVLIGEVLHELKTARKQVIQSFVDNMLGGLRDGF